MSTASTDASSRRKRPDLIAALVPELYVSHLETSLAYYAALGFTVRYRREEDAFACLRRGRAELMLEEPRGRVLLTGPLERPFGRGMNLQIAVEDAAALYRTACDGGFNILLPLEEQTYRRATDTVLVRQFVLVDPDGYLLRFSQSLGVTATSARSRH